MYMQLVREKLTNEVKPKPMISNLGLRYTVNIEQYVRITW